MMCYPLQEAITAELKPETMAELTLHKEALRTTYLAMKSST